MTVVVTVRRYLNKRSEKRNVGSKPELKNGRFFIEAEVGVTDSTGRCALCIVQRSLFNDMSYRWQMFHPTLVQLEETSPHRTEMQQFI